MCLKAIELLQVLLEETDERSIDLIVAFTEDVDLNVIIDTMFMCEVCNVLTINTCVLYICLERNGKCL